MNPKFRFWFSIPLVFQLCVGQSTTNMPAWNAVSTNESQIQGPRNGIFTAVGVTFVVPKTQYQFTVITEKGRNWPPLLTFSIICGNQVFDSVTISTFPATKTDVQIYIGNIPKIFIGYCNFTASAVDMNNNKTNVIDYGRLRVAETQNYTTIFLQTDKPIYKSGDLVRFRVIVLEENGKVPKEPKEIKISIKNSEGFIVNQLTSHTERGLLVSSIKLSSDPILGNWTLLATFEKLEESITFLVSEYILPPFKVSLKAPTAFAINEARSILVDIRAVHTYGKPVTGKVKLSIFDSLITWFGPIIKNAVLVSGRALFEINLPSDNPYFIHYINTQRPIRFNATVTEDFTNRTVILSKNLMFNTQSVYITQVDIPPFFIPGNLITFKFRVKNGDGTPVVDSRPNAARVKTDTYYYPFTHSYANSTLPPYIDVPIGTNGIVEFKIKAPNMTYFPLNLYLVYNGTQAYVQIPQYMSSPNGLYLHASTDNSKPEAGETVKVDVISNINFVQLNYALYGNSQVLSSGICEINSSRFDLLIPTGSTGRLSLVIFAVVQTSQNQLVSYSINFDVQQTASKNFIKIEISETTGEPGDNLMLTINTQANSTVAIRGIDESILSLSEKDNDINETKLRELGQWGSVSNALLYNLYQSKSYAIFRQAGFQILTNSELYSSGYGKLTYAEYQEERSRLQQSHNRGSGAVFARGNTKSAKQEPELPKKRKLFPETWLWEELDVSSNETTITRTISETLTSWIITGFSLNEEYGFALTSEPTKYTSYKSFFISFDTPYSIVKGETLQLRVLVHNYLGSPANVTVSFSNELVEFEITNPVPQVGLSSVSRQINVADSEIGVATFSIKPLTFGSLLLDATGIASSESATAKDSISKLIKVNPNGVKEVKAETGMLSSVNNEISLTFTAKFPKIRVSGTDDVKISITGDVMVPVIENIQQLIRLSYGCAEQNMLGLVPNVAVLDYLAATNRRLDSNTVNNLLFHISQAYQRELNFRNTDGSFNFFNYNNNGLYENGSTWLTAFILKTFIAARSYVTIDPKVIESSAKFLLSRQAKNGSFVENGMKIGYYQRWYSGSFSPGLALSAYVTIALADTRDAEKANTTAFDKDILSNVTASVELALGYMSNDTFLTSDLYAIILITNALIKGGSANAAYANKFFDRMNTLSINKGSTTYWNSTNNSVKSLAIEMTSYGLIATLQILPNPQNLAKGYPIARYLINQRTAFAGYETTTDTIVALQALGQYFSKANVLNGLNTTKNLNVVVTSDVDTTYTRNIDESNYMTLYEMLLPDTARSATFDATGDGIAFVQLIYSYYIDGKLSKPDFKVLAQLSATEADEVYRFSLCVSQGYTLGKSGMVLVEIAVPSGFEFSDSDLEGVDWPPQIGKLERSKGNTVLKLYYTYLTRTSSCVDIPVDRIYIVENTGNAAVKVSDYYNPTRTSTIFYNSIAS